MIEKKYRLKRTKIVATIGPTSCSRKTIKRMIMAGMNVCRINFSHCSQDQAQSIISIVRDLNLELDTHVAIMGDLQGPKIRIGLVKKDAVEFSIDLQLRVIVLSNKNEIRNNLDNI